MTDVILINSGAMKSKTGLMPMKKENKKQNLLKKFLKI